MQFTLAELELLIEALAYRASQHESMARWNPRSAGPHDRKAAAMHKLRTKLMAAGKETEIDWGKPRGQEV